MNLPISEGVIAALIGAVATTVTAFVQLMINLRKNTPESRAKRRTPWLLIFALMLGSAVGGFAYSEYRLWTHEDETKALRAEMNSKLMQLAAVTGQPQVMRDTDPLAGSAVPAASATTTAPGGQLREASALINLPACKGAQVGFATERPKCAETDALRVAVCVTVPATAQVKAVEVFARAEDSQQPWAETRVTPDRQPSASRFDEKYTERSEVDGSKQVCQGFAHWDSEKGRTLRVLVRYGA